MSASIKWTKIEPSADPTHGKPCTRSSHGLSLINNGSRLILYGGEHIARTPLESGQALWAADLDASSNSWKWRCILPNESSQTPPARVAHAQAAYNDSIVYIFGGRAGITMQEQAMSDLWRLDCSGEPGTERWSLVVPDAEKGDEPPEARSFHKMVCIGDNLYVFGGCGASHGRLADMHKFNLTTNTWQNLGASSILRGRGGPNLVPLSSGKILAVIAGFCGEESNDGHCFNVETAKWEDDALTPHLEGLRPRSVCVSGSCPSTGYSVIFGGEVDPSAKGHEGAGGFENDVLLFNETTGKYLGRTPRSGTDTDMSWPETRGWADSAASDSDGVGHLYVFGGLSGDDAAPKRLDDLWRLDVSAN